MNSLIAFDTQWGSRYGGISSFNTDFLRAFAAAYHPRAQVICIVARATPEEIEDARNSQVTLVPLPYLPSGKLFTQEQAQVGLTELQECGIAFDPDATVWLGHDRISGAAANAAARHAGGRSALIHHMSYKHYESFAEDSRAAYQKSQDQQALFQQADILLAIGPLLRDALHDLVGDAKPIHMLIPGLADIDSRPTPKTFTAFLSGRLSEDAARIKQGHLGIAAFALAHREARQTSKPEGLSREPLLVLRGVDFDSSAVAASQQSDPETELKKFAQSYANGVINLHALPYTQNRGELFRQLAGASVALMPSWHEGFGLVAWEAIAAGVPLIVSAKSGVYRLLEEETPGAGPGCVYQIDVAGDMEAPFFSPEDLTAVVKALTDIAYKPDVARKKAGILRELMGGFSWPACVEKTVEIFGWQLQKGSIPAPNVAAPVMSAEPIPAVSSGPLSMPVRRWQSGVVLADSQLLRAEEALVPFDPARQADLDELNAWLDDAVHPQAVRLITGPGGLGKTRLALELCWQRLAAGWYAGLLDNDLRDSDLSAAWKTLRHRNQPLLIVIDYAETRQTALLRFIKAVLGDPGARPVRILLLARNGGEWWDNLPGKDKDCEAFLGGYATTGPHRLPALHNDIADRRLAYQSALNAFADTLGVVPPTGVPDLNGEHFQRPLYLHMAALLALRGERPNTAQGLTKALLNHERRYWGRSLVEIGLTDPERDAEQLLALSTLVGGFPTAKAALECWGRSEGGSISAAQFNPLFHALEPLYPGKQGLQAVRPDLLGETLVALALLRPTGAGLLDAVLSNQAGVEIRRHALTVIARLSLRHPELHETLVEALVRHFAHCSGELVSVAQETESELPVLAEAAFKRLVPNSQSQVAGLLKTRLVEESVALAGFYCSIGGYLANKAHEKYLRKSSDIIALNEYAIALGNYAEQLYRAGHNETALPVSWKVLKAFEKLKNLNRQRFEPNYANSLSNHANYLWEAGNDQDALEYARQAVEIRCVLAKINPDCFEPDYATSLSNYAGNLGEMGRDGEALEYAGQALEIRRSLAKKNPDYFEPDYATSLSNYAGNLGDMGQACEALEHAGQALEIRRSLAKKNPDRFEPDYAISLNNYANHLSEMGKASEALEYAGQALDIYQALAKKNLDRFEPGYAMSLNNFSSHLSEMGKVSEALEYTGKALKIRRNLAKKNPDRFEPDYARSLDNYAGQLGNLGRNCEALEYAGRALEIRRNLVGKNPARFEPVFATSLKNYANHLSENGQDAEALVHVGQALEIFQLLAKKNPVRFSGELFSNKCYLAFLEWLDDRYDSSIRRAGWDEIPEAVPEIRRPRLLVFLSFFWGCLAVEERSLSFNRLLVLWNELLQADKTATEEFHLCAAVWCAKFVPSAVANMVWLADWERFIKRRNGRLPCWMDKVARRLDFAWPEWQKDA